MNRQAVSKILVGISLPIALLLVWSVFLSGYLYMFDSDEVMHTHMMYLLSYGYKTFSDFFSIHAPLFHVLLLPFLKLRGFALDSLFFLRTVMILLYVFRLIAGWIFVSKLFSKNIAWIFILFILVDPFAVFAAMQIRPDSLMMLVFFSALLVVVEAYRTQSKYLWIAGGILCSVSVLVSLKISPSVAVLVLFLLVYFLIKKRLDQCVFYISGMLMPFVVFCFYFFLQGSFVEMVRQLVIDSKAMSDALWYPTRLGFFYGSNNVFIYGLGGKPVTWYVAILLPVLAIGGILYAILRWRKNQTKIFWILVCVVMLVIQYAFLSTVKSMFIQYYLTVNWILSFFAAIFLHAFFSGVKKPLWLVVVFRVGAFVLFIAVAIGSIKANISRATMIFSDTDRQRIERRWEIIPTDKAVFPVFLFRPLSQPIPYGYFIPEVPHSIRSRYPSDLATIQNPNLDYLILTAYHMQFLDSATKEYIQDHFTKTTQDEELWIRNTP